MYNVPVNNRLTRHCQILTISAPEVFTRL